MPASWNEQSLEQLIADHLIINGYHTGHSSGFSAHHGVDLSFLLKFLESTQPDELDEWKREGGAHWQTKLLDALRDQIGKRGVAALWREELKCGACRFKLYFPRPTNMGDDAQVKRWQSNLFSVTRQLHFSPVAAKLSLDLAVFVNGLPFATFELKNAFTNQTARDAIRQYRENRDPKEPIFGFKRCLVHFAADSDEVWMTTHLRADKTGFLPFNRGTAQGGGNPVNEGGLKTDYLWRDVLSRESVGEIIEKFAQLTTEKDETGKVKEKLIFPRFHQRDAVLKLLADVRAHGAGGKYLIQHSAGSGKSNTIAWLCHALVETIVNDKSAFDTVVLVTDRRVLDKQISDTVKGFAHLKGVVVHADKSGQQLGELINGDAKIVITTLQKFSPALDAIGSAPDKKFAIVIDEAHSSQSGDSAASMNAALGGKTDDFKDLPYDERILAIIQSRAQLKNASYFAFTATPKDRTLQQFGVPHDETDGKRSFRPFHLYSTKQAIAEGFILDVLRGYRSLQSIYKVGKSGDTVPDLDVSGANKRLKRYVETNAPAIERKTRVMLDHFGRDVVHLLGNRARAMVVTGGIETAIRYKWAFDKAIADSNLPYQSIVAFSGEKEVDGLKYTEAGLNGFDSGLIPDKFKSGEYKFLIVADKFQTGFDEPLLCAMYVDKPLGDIQAVQTLSRLNRCYPGKKQTFILDFFNKFETIEAAFKKYFEMTTLSDRADKNRLNELESALLDAPVFDLEDARDFCLIYLDENLSINQIRAQAEPMLDAAAARFKTDLSRDEQIQYKGDLKAFVRAFEFFVQVGERVRPEWFELATFGGCLLPKLPVISSRDEDEDVLSLIELESYRIFERPGQTSIDLEGGGVLDPKQIASGAAPAEAVKDKLTVIIENFNQRFGKEADGSQEILLTQELPALLEQDANYQAAKKHSTRQHAMDAALKVIADYMQKRMMNQTELYKKFVQDDEFKRALIEDIFRNDYDAGAGV